MDNIELLIKFGLTRQEAIIYKTLLTKGILTGYEAAKVTGISRSNTYSALAGLVDKGAADIIEGAATKYVPVCIDEFCNNKIRFLDEAKNYLRENITEAEDSHDGYITVAGYNHIVDKMKNMVNDAAYRIYISMTASIISILRSELLEAINRGIKVVIITDEDVSLEGAVIYKASKEEYQIRLIVDSKNVLTGELVDEQSSCLYSDKKNLASLFKEALGNEIKLIELTSK